MKTKNMLNSGSIKYPMTDFPVNTSYSSKIEPLPHPMDVRDKVNDLVIHLNGAIDRIDILAKELYAIKNVVDKIAKCEAIKAMINLEKDTAKRPTETTDNTQ